MVRSGGRTARLAVKERSRLLQRNITAGKENLFTKGGGERTNQGLVEEKESGRGLGRGWELQIRRPGATLIKFF